MKAPRATLWKISDLTRTKHHILRGYLEYWLPDVLQEHKHVYILDGFAGPGEYIGGEIGSPLIAIDTLLAHTCNPEELGRVSFLFIDNHRKRHYHLRDLIERRKRTQPAIETLNCRFLKGDFAKKLHERLTAMQKQTTPLAPIFAFVDPFGFSDIPIAHIAHIMQHPHSEVLITFMYEEINRFLSHPDEKIQHHLTQLFGTEDWRDIDLHGDRELQVCQLYRTQLNTIGNTKYVCMFRIKNQNNASDYFLVFGTHSLAHLEKMKDVFWEIDPKNGHTFSAFANCDQPFLFQPEPDYVQLARQLRSHFQGSTISIDELDEYILSETHFCRKDREHTLRYLEQTSSVTINAPELSHTYDNYRETAYICFR